MKLIHSPTFLMRFLNLIYRVCLVLTLTGCSVIKPSESLQQNSLETPSTYFSTMNHLLIEVAYEPGAEPFVGQFNSGKNYWALLEDNLKALFQGRSQNISYTIPKTLPEMIAMPAQNKSSWTVSDLITAGNFYRKNYTTTQTGAFIILFLNGYFNDGTNPSTSTIGVSISGTTIITIFKQVVTASGASANGIVPKYVEQSTLIHEMGHALGLVNAGIPLSSSHQDAAHGAHCSNSNCVMNWLNEGRNDLITYLQQVIITGNDIMFGNECLQDTRSFNP